MMSRRIGKYIRLFCIIACLSGASLAAASQYHGQITFHGWPVPGATVTVTQGAKSVTTVSDQGGLFTFTDLVVSEKSIGLYRAVLKWSVHPTDKEMYSCSVVDQFPRWIVHRQSRLDCSEFRYDGASDATCPSQRSE